MSDNKRTDWTWGQIVQEIDAMVGEWRNVLTGEQRSVARNDIKLLMTRMRDDLIRRINDLEVENIELRRDAARNAWPTGDEAAEQLALAAYDMLYNDGTDDVLITDELGCPLPYSDLEDDERVELTARFAAALARLNAPEGDA